MRALPAHRRVVDVRRRRVARVSGLLYGERILSYENVGWNLGAFFPLYFILLWIQSDYRFYSSFDNEIMHKYFV